MKESRSAAQDLDSAVKKAAEDFFGVRFASFKRIHCGNSSVNWRAVEACEPPRAYFVKLAKPHAVETALANTAAVATPLVPRAAFGARSFPFSGRLVCAFEWIDDGASVPPWLLSKDQIQGIADGYRELSKVFAGRIHGDLHYKNFFLSSSRLSACFDLEKMREGAPAEDLLRIFVHALERTRFWRFSRTKAILGNLQLMILASGLERSDFIHALELYEAHKNSRRKKKSRFALFATIEKFFRSRYYSRIRKAILASSAAG